VRRARRREIGRCHFVDANIPPASSDLSYWSDAQAAEVDMPPRVDILHRGSKSSAEFEARLCSGDPNCTPITLREEGVSIHREDAMFPRSSSPEASV
jgi:hypothetical protein